MKFRHSKFLLVAGMAFLILIGTFSTTASAAVVWSDDFSDGNYDGWTLLEGGFEIPVSPKSCLKGSSTGPNIIYHPSVQTNGEWLFELYEDVSYNGSIEVFFMATETSLEDFEGYSLFLTYSTVFCGFHLCRWNYTSIFDQSAKWVLASYYIWEDPDPLPALGWHWYNVTRDLNGDFYISRDNVELIVSDPAVEAMDFDSLINTSDKFIVRAEEDASIDSIVVGIDLQPITIDTSTTTTTTNTTTTAIMTSNTDTLGQYLPLIALGGGAVLVIVVFVMKKR